MELSTVTECPNCGTEPEVQLGEFTLNDKVVKATSEEFIVEINCDNQECNEFWEAVYTFSGNKDQ